MKTSLAILFTIAALSSFTLRAGDLNSLPDFMSKDQMAKWDNIQADKSSFESPTTFYTGKPYMPSAGGYLFKYRILNPEVTRWTSADPSGYPDGVNNNIYCKNPCQQLDSTGLDDKTITDGGFFFNVTFTLQYSYTSQPTLVGTPVVGGFGSSLSGGIASYSITLSAPTLDDITTVGSSTDGVNSKTYVGVLDYTLTLTSTFGLTIGSLTLGLPGSTSAPYSSNWMVTAYE